MSRNKSKITKLQTSTKIEQQNIQVKVSTEQKIQSLVANVNDIMYQSLQAGNIKINDPQRAAKKMVKDKNNFLLKQILNGQFQINQNKVPYNLSSKNPQNYHISRDQINNLNQMRIKTASNNQSQILKINQTLKQLHENIKKSKQVQRNEMKKLEQKAKEFIAKVNKDKQQFQENLRNKKSQSRIFVRAYSQDTIRIMKDKLVQRVELKRKQLAQRLETIQKRKKQRVENEVTKEVSYWQKVKKYESCKVLRKQEPQKPLLPEINIFLSHSAKSGYEVSKNNFLNKIGKDQRSVSVLGNKFEQIDNYVMKAKLKLQNYKSKLKNQQQKSRLKIQKMLQKDQIKDLYISNNSHKSNNSINPQVEKHRLGSIDKFKVILQKNNFKKLNDEQQKNQTQNTNKKDKKNGQLSSLIVSFSQNNQLNENLSVNASIIKPSKIPYQVSLQQSWNLTLNKIRFHQLDKVKGLSILAQIQKRLDKYDKDGIISRLKLKADTINNLQKNNDDQHIFYQKLNANQNVTESQIDSTQVTISNPEVIVVKNSSSSQQPNSQKNLNFSQNQFISNHLSDKKLLKA